MIEALNGVPISLKVSEFYQGLSKGTIDGLMTTPGPIFDFGTQEVVKEVYQARFGGGATFVVMNNQFYESLPGDLKAVIDENTGYDRSRWAAAYLREAEARGLAEAGGLVVRAATVEELGALGIGFEAGRQAYLNGGPEHARYLEPWKPLWLWKKVAEPERMIRSAAVRTAALERC